MGAPQSQDAIATLEKIRQECIERWSDSEGRQANDLEIVYLSPRLRADNNHAIEIVYRRAAPKGVYTQLVFRLAFPPGTEFVTLSVVCDGNRAAKLVLSSCMPVEKLPMRLQTVFQMIATPTKKDAALYPVTVSRAA